MNKQSTSPPEAAGGAARNEAAPVSRKSAKRLALQDTFSTTVEVVDAVVIGNEPTGDGSVVIRATDFRLRNIFTTHQGGGEPIERSAEVFLCGTIDEPELVINAGASQRFVCRGLSDADRKKLSTAPAEQISAVVADRNERERSAVAEQLLESLSSEARDKLISSVLNRTPEEKQ